MSASAYAVNHYKHHLGDYAKDTAHLSLLEHGVYGQLMRRCYATEAPLPGDVTEVCRLIAARSRDEREAVKNVLKDFFELRDDGYHQKRIDREIAEYQTKADRNREVGKAGGRPRREPTENPQETQTVSEAEPKSNPNETLASSHKPILSPSLRSGERGRKRPKHSLPEGFGLSERVIDWAKGKGYDRLQEHLDAFRLKAVANDYRYVDWDHALMNAIEADWAGLRRKGSPEPRGQDAIAVALANIAAKEANATH